MVSEITALWLLLLLLGTSKNFSLLFFFFFSFGHSTYGILVAQPGIDPTPPVVEVQGFNHWTTLRSPSIPFQNEVQTYFPEPVVIRLLSVLRGYSSFLVLE